MEGNRASTTPPAPDAVQRIVGRMASLEFVWRNDLGGLTYRWSDESRQRYVKWVPRGAGIPTLEEAARLQWARQFTEVPVVEQVGVDETGSWLVTRALPGRSAVDDRWLARPDTAVAAIGYGLRQLHDRLPVAECPFDWTTTRRLADALTRRGSGSFDRTHWNQEHLSLTDTDVIARLRDEPDPDPVVCHGDPCSPNTLLTDDGQWSGHVDLDQLGRGDRWADLAVATWATEWNYGPGWASPLLDAYGVEPDAERTAYYRLLWDLG